MLANRKCTRYLHKWVARLPSYISLYLAAPARVKWNWKRCQNKAKGKQEFAQHKFWCKFFSFFFFLHALFLFFFDWILYGWWTPQLLPIRLYVCVWNAANCYGQANVKRATTVGNCVFPADCKFSWKLNTNFWYMALALCCSRYCCLLTACNISNNISTFQHSPSSADKILLRLPQDPAFPLLPAPFNVALCSGIYLFVFVRAAQLRLTLLTFYNMANTNTHAVPLPPTHTHIQRERVQLSRWLRRTASSILHFPLHSHILFSQTFLEIVEIFQPCFALLLHCDVKTSSYATLSSTN